LSFERTALQKKVSNSAFISSAAEKSKSSAAEIENLRRRDIEKLCRREIEKLG
jgi:hypothetical protein